MRYRIYKLYQQDTRQLLSIVDLANRAVTLAVWCEHTDTTLLRVANPTYQDFCRAFSLVCSAC